MVLASGAPGLSAGERQVPAPARDDAAPAAQQPARLGSSFSLDLGGDENLDFIWIAPLKMWVGKYEVSNGPYVRYDAGHNSTNLVDREMNETNQPVVDISWEDASNYCGWLNRHNGSLIPAGFVFRLPSEQEWETYARCGDRRVYPWGNQWPPPNDYNYRGVEGSGILYALFQDEQFVRGHNDGYVVTAPITRSGKNTWGLYGVGGNAWEWCADWADANKTTRVIRGGAWNNERENILRISHRADAAPDWKNEFIGFRVVIGPPLP
jgi:formylglycine-generating enzyme required for sulfatase activity